MLKTTRSFDDLAPKLFRADGDEVVGGGGSRVNETVKNPSKPKKFKNKILTCFSDIGAMREPMFLTPKARKAFNHLRQAFIEALIL